MIPLSHGWRVVLAYSVVAGGTQALWLTFAPIDTSAAHRYGLSSGTIGWLSEIVPFVYIFLALPGGATPRSPTSAPPSRSAPGCWRQVPW